jgi:5-methylcytosine-specific restriction endonuclease McrA
MRSACKECGSTEGTLRPTNGQNCVYCNGCNRLAYNAPKSETGEAVRSLRTRPDISPSKRARILDRDNHTCVACHRSKVPLDVGHLLSVSEGRIHGLTDEELWHDENLAAMCASCNSGYSSRSVSLRLAIHLRARTRDET